jgi:hypothetical protein
MCNSKYQKVDNEFCWWMKIFRENIYAPQLPLLEFQSGYD